MNITNDMTNRPVPSGKRPWHFIAIAMSMVMLCSVLLVAFHHHDDDQDHDDCSICAVAHHRTADIRITPPAVNYLPLTFLTWFAALVLTSSVIRFYHSPQDRAPPA